MALNRNASTRTDRTARTTATTATQMTSGGQYIGLEALEIPSQARYEIVLANKILAKQGIIEAYGSVSQRHPLFPTTHFIMTFDKAPASVVPSDVQVYRIDTAEPVAAKGPRATAERFVHSEIYKYFTPDEVGSVVACHTAELLPFTIASVLPFKAAINKASFLGSHAAPIFDLASLVGPHNDTLVRDVRSGAALAKHFDKTPPPVAPKKEGFFSGPKKPQTTPVVPKARSCVLVRGTGAVLVGADIHIATLRAIFARENAKVLTTLHSLIGGIPGLNTSDEPHHGVRMLGQVECDLHTASQARDAKRSWDVWVAQVIDDIPGAQDGYHSEGTVLRRSLERKSNEEEEDLPRTTFKYSTASAATETTAPTSAVGRNARQSTQSARASVRSGVVPDSQRMSKAPSIDPKPLDAVAPVTGASLVAPVPITSGYLSNSTSSQRQSSVSAAEVASRDFGTAPVSPTSKAITGLGHAVGENSTHDGPAGEIVTVDQLAHKMSANNVDESAAQREGGRFREEMTA